MLPAFHIEPWLQFRDGKNAVRHFYESVRETFRGSGVTDIPVVPHGELFKKSSDILSAGRRRDQNGIEVGNLSPARVNHIESPQRTDPDLTGDIPLCSHLFHCRGRRRARTAQGRAAQCQRFRNADCNWERGF